MFDQSNATIGGITIDPGGLGLAVCGMESPVRDSRGRSHRNGFERSAAISLHCPHQTVNTPQVVARATGNIASLSVIGGQVMASGSGSTGTQTWDYGATTPQLPSSIHGSGTIAAAGE